MNVLKSDERSLRVKDERKRLGLLQEEAAVICHVTLKQFGRYERGETQIDGEPLRLFGASGADVGYILTGVRSNVDDLARYESMLVANQQLPIEQQERMNQLAFDAYTKMIAHRFENGEVISDIIKMLLLLNAGNLSVVSGMLAAMVKTQNK